MNRNRLATPFEVVDGMDLMRRERKRIEVLVASNEFKGNRHWEWMPKWLAVSDEQHLREAMGVGNWTANNEYVEFDANQDSIDNDYVCHLCFKPKRYLLSTSFSFCDEDGCGMKICRECALKIGELATKMPKEGNSNE